VKGKGKQKWQKRAKRAKRSLFALLARFCHFCFPAVFFVVSLNKQRVLTSGVGRGIERKLIPTEMWTWRWIVTNL
jgi:hypothetical protein